MEIRNIPMPGLVTRLAADIRVQIVGREDSEIGFVISYRIGEDYDPTADYSIPVQERFGEIRFNTVIECRFGWDTYFYDDFPEVNEMEWEFLAANNELDFIEIVGSPYIENMLSKGLRSHLKDRMGGGSWGGIQESDVKHYRIAFDNYGRFDILALGVVTREYCEENAGEQVIGP